MRRSFLGGSSIAILTLALGLPTTTSAQEAAPVAVALGDATFVPIPGLPRGADFHVVNGSPDAAFELYFRLQPGVEVPMHFHSSAERLVGLDGMMAMSFPDGRKEKLSAGAYLFIPPGSHHSATCGGDVPCLAYLIFDEGFDITWVGDPPADPNPMPDESS